MFNYKENKKYILSYLILAFFIVVGIIAFYIFNQQKNLLTNNLDNININNENYIKNKDEKNNPNNTETISASKNTIGDNSVVQKIPSEKTSKNYIDFSGWNSSCNPALVVVNKYNPIPTNYNSKIIDYKDVKINSIIKNDLDNMINDAAKLGLKIYPSSGYRSVERQTMLFNKQVSKCKKQGYKSETAESVAATVVARPRTSEHHTGLAIDFNEIRDDFYKTKEYNWLIKNAAEYGFILRYPKDKIDITNVIYEPWHFRYVGKEFAKEIIRTGLCYEEYIESIMKK